MKQALLNRKAGTQRFLDRNPGYHAAWKRRRKEGDRTP
jgi:hypothetical protein